MNLLQPAADNLSAGSLRQFITEDDDSRIFIRCRMLFNIILDLFFELIRSFCSRYEYDRSLDDLSANLIRCSGDAAFQNIGQFHDHIFDLERADPITG